MSQLTQRLISSPLAIKPASTKMKAVEPGCQTQQTEI